MSIIPIPKSVQPEICDADYIAFTPTVARNEEYLSAITSFLSYTEKLHQVSFMIREEGTICIRQDRDLEAEAYKIVVSEEGVSINASDRKGVNHAFATILQMMQVEEGRILLPKVVIKDQPNCSYRGMMVDLARSFRTFPFLLAYVDMCYFYKASALQLHFTDDEGYTLPSNSYPRLSTEGRSYTYEEIGSLVEYAHARGVELVPELDVPGHCTCFAESYGDLFGRAGVICQHEDSMEAMRTLFRELCDMFPYSKHIHIGGDEAIAMEAWTKCPDCLDYGKKVGIDITIQDGKKLAELFYAHFISEMADVCFEKGKQPIVWEGFGKEANDRISKQIVVMSWENLFQLTPDLLEAGFPVINCSWNPTYVVTPHTMWKPQDIYEWSVYQWQATHPNSPILECGYECPKSTPILGGQLHAWSGDIRKEFENETEGVTVELKCLAERLPMLVERTWNVETKGSYDELKDTIETLENKLYTIIGKEIAL